MQLIRKMIAVTDPRNAGRRHGRKSRRTGDRWALVSVLALALLLGCAAPPSPRAAGAVRAGAPGYCRELYLNYLMAQLEEKSGQWQQAADSLQKALRCDPDSSFLHRELAMVHMRRGDVNKALDILESYLKRHPQDAEGWVLVGRLRQRSGNRDAARSAYERALGLDPQQKDIYLLLGRLYDQDGNHPAALAIFEQYVRHFPDVFIGHFLLAGTYEALGRFAEAVAAYEKAVALAADKEEPRYELIRLYENMGRLDDAAAQYRTLLEANPHNARAGLALALWHHHRGAEEQAERLIERFARRSQQDAAVVHTLVRIYLGEESDPEAARYLLDGMCRVLPESGDLNYLSGIVYDRLERFDQALVHFQRVGTDSRFYGDAVLHAGYLFQKDGHTAQAIPFLREAIRQRPENPEFYLFLGTFYEELENFPEAEQALRQGIDIAPENARLYFRLGVVYDKWQHKSDSIAQMKRVIELDPDHTNALNYLGYTYAEMGIELDTAEQLIRRALDRKPEDGYITDSLGWVYFKRGEYQKALEILERASRLAPLDPVILEHVGDTYHQLGQSQKALEFYRHALKVKGKDRETLMEKIRSIAGNLP